MFKMLIHNCMGPLKMTYAFWKNVVNCFKLKRS